MMLLIQTADYPRRLVPAELGFDDGTTTLLATNALNSTMVDAEAMQINSSLRRLVKPNARAVS